MLLGLDDVFLLHEEVFSVYLGTPEVLVYTLYTGLAIAYLWVFRKVLIRANHTFLALAFVCFALSIGLDLLNLTYINPYLFEDGFKFIGLVAWLAYFWQFAVSRLRSDDGLVYPIKEEPSLLPTTRR